MSYLTACLHSLFPISIQNYLYDFLQNRVHTQPDYGYIGVVTKNSDELYFHAEVCCREDGLREIVHEKIEEHYNFNTNTTYSVGPYPSLLQ